MLPSLTYAPYQNERLDALYNLQFCEFPELNPNSSHQHRLCQQLLTTDHTPRILQSLAFNEGEETHIRIQAFQKMRQQQLPVPYKLLLGVIIEVGLGEGLEILSVYTDERVRYISAEKRLAVVETPTPALEQLIHKLLQDANTYMKDLSPCHSPRHQPPSYGCARFTFLASDGIYVGEGEFKHLQEIPQAADLIDDALNLLHEIIITGSKKKAHKKT